MGGIKYNSKGGGQYTSRVEHQDTQQPTPAFDLQQKPQSHHSMKIHSQTQSPHHPIHIIPNDNSTLVSPAPKLPYVSQPHVIPHDYDSRPINFR